MTSAIKETLISTEDKCILCDFKNTPAVPPSSSILSKLSKSYGEIFSLPLGEDVGSLHILHSEDLYFCCLVMNTCSDSKSHRYLAHLRDEFRVQFPHVRGAKWEKNPKTYSYATFETIVKEVSNSYTYMIDNPNLHGAQDEPAKETEMAIGTDEAYKPLLSNGRDMRDAAKPFAIGEESTAGKKSWWAGSLWCILLFGVLLPIIGYMIFSYVICGDWSLICNCCAGGHTGGRTRGGGAKRMPIRRK